MVLILTPFEPHIILNELCFIALSASVWEIVVKFLN